MSTTISTAISIDAGPQAVWDVLTDFAAYGDWNPLIDRAEGALEVDARLVLHLAASGGRGMRFRPTVLVAEPGRELRWRGKLGASGVFDGEHSFVLTADADGTTRLVQSERFSGLLVPLLRGIVTKTRAGFEELNHALKQRVEGVNLSR